jgi:hypothetical protein
MAHRTFVALALGLLSLAGGCTEDEREPAPAAEAPKVVPFDSLATLDTTTLTFCCDPNAPFPQTIGTFTLTRYLVDEVEFTPTGQLEIGAPVVVEYRDDAGNPTQDYQDAFAVVETYTVSANACPPATGWNYAITVTEEDGDYAIEVVLIDNTCPPPADPPVELICGTLPDQIWVTEGPIVNVTTADPVLVVGTNEGACGGTVAGGLSSILAPFSPASSGAVFLRHVPSNTQAAFGYGPNGIALRGFDTDWGFTLVDPATPGVDRNTTDVIPTANNPDSAEAIVTRYGRNRVETWGYDTTDDNFTDVDTLGVTLFPGADGKMISACRPEVGGPVYVLFNSPASQLYVKDDPDDLVTPAILVATLGNDGRRVRHEGTLLFVDCFADDTLAVLDPGAATPVVVTVTVGDGPIGIDTEPLPSGNIAVLTTGFNDHKYAITIVHADGTLVSNTIEPVPSGGLNPGSGVFLPDGKVAISCNGSDKIVVFVP